jgi:glycine/D-amino acid oxidase-like deaminating enzyme
MAKLTNSTWQSSVDKKQRYPSLKREINVDIAVLGAGIAGATTAYMLRTLGRKVALIEKGIIGKEAASGFTTGFLSTALDTDLIELSKMFGNRKAKLFWQSQQDAIETVAKIIKDEKIDCEFKRVSEYFYANKEEQVTDLKEEYALAKKLGFKVKFHDYKKLKFPNFGSMEVLNQAKFNALAYIQSLI